MQPTLPITVKGRNGQVSFDGAAVTITRDGFIAGMSQGHSSKMLPLRQIGAVQLKPNSWRTAGYVEFTIAGGRELQRRRSSGRDHAENENVVIFGKRVEPQMEQLVDMIRTALAQQGA